VGDTGLEQPIKHPTHITIPEQGGAESGAVDAAGEAIDPLLADLISSWPSLPEEARSSILLVLRTFNSVPSEVTAKTDKSPPKPDHR